MATSGSFTGSRGGGSTGPWLTLDWSRIDVDEVNNKSLIRLTLKLNADASISFSSSKSGVLEGTSFTYTGGMSGAGSKTLKTLDIWCSHNSDGTLTRTFDASFNIAISWGGSTVSSLTVSGSASITAIPQASTFTAFTLTNTVLNKDTGVTVNYTLGRQSTSFSQDMTLKLGTKVIKSWNTASTGALTQALSTTEVNSIITSNINSASGTLTLTMQTKSGSTAVGDPVSRTVSFTLNSTIAPTATGLTVSIYGTGKDKTIGKYVQNVSKVTASVADTAGYGASIKTTTIVVKRQSDGGNSQTINGDNGTTAGVLTLSGVYSITATVTDSRNRTATATTTITVDAYSPPTITTFSASRDKVTTSTVNATVYCGWVPMGTLNPATVTVKGVDKAGVTTTLYTLSNSTVGGVNATQNYLSQSDASSYTYTLTVTDAFGKVATAVSKVGVSFVEFTISKGQGISAGKIWERGALDVAGEAYFDKGTVHLPTNRYATAGYGLHAHNADIGGLNNLWWNDQCADDTEAMQFLNTGKTIGSTNVADYTSVRALDGILYVNSNPVNVVPTATTLWSGAYYLNDSQTITPSKKISDCANGWLLCWSDYAGGVANDYDLVLTYVHKKYVANFPGNSMLIPVPTSATSLTMKYAYINDATITGHAQNDDGTSNGNISAPTGAVIRRVWEW